MSGLTDEELAAIVATFDESEDEFDISDDDDDYEYVMNTECIMEEDNLEDVNRSMAEDVPDENVPPISSPNGSKITYRNVLWTKKNLNIHQDSTDFKGSSKLPDYILNLETPFDFFNYFLDDNFIQKICTETNLYASQKNPNKSTSYDKNDIRKFIGICQYMSVVSLPRTRCYWRQDIGIDDIQKVMTINTFEALKNVIHFNDNNNMLSKEHSEYDKLFKIRPLIDELNKKFTSIPKDSKLSIDEQICATKIRHHLKQYLPLKPNKWGFKLFVLCDSSGYAYNFEIYSGPDNFFTKRLNEEPNLGSSSNVVVRLARSVNRHENYTIFCDNYYMSLPLIVYMEKQGIFMLGTVRKNRIPNCKLSDDKKMKKLPRGTSEEYVTNIDGTEVSNVGWFDNKLVTFLSTKYGVLPITQVNRYDRKQKKRIAIDCPNIVKEYNKHMGGVDLLDSHIGRYHISLRSRKWYFRIFCHLLDVASINAWLLYHRANSERGEKIKKTLWEFRAEIAKCLCLMGVQGPKPRGRPSDIERNFQEKRHRGPTSTIPPKNIRVDQESHWTMYDETRQRCKLPGCKGFSHFKCSKCAVHLCITKDRNCFYKFHN